MLFLYIGPDSINISSPSCTFSFGRVWNSCLSILLVCVCRAWQGPLVWGVRQGITSHHGWCLYHCVSSPTEDFGITISLVTCYSCHRFISICQAGTHAVCFVWHDCARYLAIMAQSPQASTYHWSWCWCWDLLINLSWITKISSLTHILFLICFQNALRCLSMIKSYCT